MQRCGSLVASGQIVCIGPSLPFYHDSSPYRMCRLAAPLQDLEWPIILYDHSFPIWSPLCTCAQTHTQTHTRARAVVCTIGGARRRPLFEPWFVCPLRVPLARSPPLHPRASAPNTTTVVRCVACLVFVVFFLSLPSPDRRAGNRAHNSTRHQGQRTYSSSPCQRYRQPTVAASPPQFPLQRGHSNRCFQGSSRLRSRCGTRPKARVWDRKPSSSQCFRMVMSSAECDRSYRTSHHTTTFNPLAAHELRRHLWVSHPRICHQQTGIGQWGLRAGQHRSMDQGCKRR